MKFLLASEATLLLNDPVSCFHKAAFELRKREDKTFLDVTFFSQNLCQSRLFRIRIFIWGCQTINSAKKAMSRTMAMFLDALSENCLMGDLFSDTTMHHETMYAGFWYILNLPPQQSSTWVQMSPLTVTPSGHGKSVTVIECNHS